MLMECPMSRHLPGGLQGGKVKDVMLTEGGCCYFHAVVQIEKETEEDARRAIDAAIKAHRSLKHVLVVDSDINIHDPRDLEYAPATRMRGDEDIVLYPNVRGSTLDPRSNEGMTTKVGVDATARLDRLWKFQRLTPEGRLNGAWISLMKPNDPLSAQISR